MCQEVEVVITLSESKVVCQLQYRNTNRLKKYMWKVYVEMVRQIVESEAKNDEDAE